MMTRPFSILRRSLLLACAVSLVLLSLETASAAPWSTPQLNVILPRGVQRGAEHTLRFSGARLGDAEQVFLYDTGIEIAEIKVVDDNNLDVTIRVAADCRQGEHVAQVRTRTGISDYRSFFVGVLSELNEAEPNSEFSEAQVVPVNHTVNGTIDNEDRDFFRISAKQGERINVEIEAVRLGFMFDPFIAVLDADRFELAVSDDSAFGKQDGVLSVIAPADGEYTVLVRESAYGGNGNCRYRLHIGTFPRPTIAYPAGGKPGETSEITFLGDATGPITQSIALPSETGFRSGLFVEDAGGISPSPVQFRLSPLENVMETEDDGHWTETAAASVPAAFNGIIGQPGDYDYFKFTGTKGQVLDIECYARRVGSGLDPVINVFRADNKQHVQGDDDARRPDCFMRITIPEDGDYFLRVRDHRNRGQADFVYRVEMTVPQPALSFGIPRVDRYSQLRQNIAVPRGNRFATQFTASRQNFGGELQLLAENLPPGIRMIAQPMHANLNVMPVVFEADEQAELSGALVDFRGRHVDEATNISGSYSNLADFALGEPNNALYYGCTVDKLAFAVIEKLPFRLEIVQPQAPLVQDGAKSLKIIAHRDEGFDAPIRIQFPFRTPGIGTQYQIELPQGQSEIDYPLNANGNAAVGKWPVYVIGYADLQGQAWASSQLAELEVAAPFVQMEMKWAVCEQGQPAQFVCTLNHLTPFEGEATAELLGLPPNTTAQPLTFNRETAELTFEVTTTAETPVGIHKSVFCRITITHNGEPVVSTAGRSQLQVTKPKPPEETPPAETPATETPANQGEGK